MNIEEITAVADMVNSLTTAGIWGFTMWIFYQIIVCFSILFGVIYTVKAILKCIGNCALSNTELNSIAETLGLGSIFSNGYFNADNLNALKKYIAKHKE